MPSAITAPTPEIGPGRGRGAREFRAELKPEHKQRWVAERQQQAHVVGPGAPLITTSAPLHST